MKGRLAPGRSLTPALSRRERAAKERAGRDFHGNLSTRRREIASTMNSSWQCFLAARSAQIDAEGTVRFAESPREADCALMDLSVLGLIAVSGPEAETFLQGQLTNEVIGLSSGQSLLGSYCNPKGRVLSTFRLFKLDETVYLQLPRTQVAATAQRLGKYLLRAKARIEDASDRFATIGVAGDCATNLLARHLDSVPTGDNQLSRQAIGQAQQPATTHSTNPPDSGDLVAIRVPGPVPRFAILAPPASLQGLWDGLAANASILNADYWALLDIRAGIPTVYPETSEAFVPQMANLDLLEGVSFKKGCYTGQEVVARMRYLGKLKRRMYRALVRAEERPAPGAELHCETSSSAQATGRVVDAQMNRDGDYELLVVVEIQAAEQGEVRLGGPAGPLVSFSKPPYGFPPDA